MQCGKWEECVANGKGAWTRCGILFVRRLGGNPRASSMLYMVLTLQLYDGLKISSFLRSNAR